jgi:hypothetical protein
MLKILPAVEIPNFGENIQNHEIIYKAPELTAERLPSNVRFSDLSGNLCYRISELHKSMKVPQKKTFEICHSPRRF